MPRTLRYTLALLVVLVAIALGWADPPNDHWAWKRPVRPNVPNGSNKSASVNPVDAFIRARLNKEGLTPAPPATREQLIRRVTFDLTGLPPTPEEIDAFIKDTSATAYEKVVDRLLASPRYGERWGRHWLDIARYADTNGYEFDEPRPDAWRYRDYVIRSFNDDKPYDRFIVEQVAGDMAFPDDIDARVATGFNLLGPDMTDSANQAQRRLNTLTDMTDTTGLAFLALTITCARCHDHKFEPIPQTDYYRLLAFFTPAEFRRDLPVATPAEVTTRATALRTYLMLTKDVRARIDTIEGPHRKRLYETKLAKLPQNAQVAHRTPPEKRDGGQQELVAETEKKVAVTDAEVAKQLSIVEKAELDDLRKTLKTFDAKRPPASPVAMGLGNRSGAPAKTYLLERGELNNRGAEVQPGYPTIVAPATAVAGLSKQLTRLDLAKWIASPDNPLTARVIVNRLWQHHFGRGLVATSSDFGTRGEEPTHPELLDWLAIELASGGRQPPVPSDKQGADAPRSPKPWSLKRIHKLMLLSETYQQSTQSYPTGAAKDPQNLLLWRMNRLRLEGEAVRDSLLFVSGRLNMKMGGPGVVVPENAGATGGSRPLTVTADTKEHQRRSIYLFARRNLRHPFLSAFDLPDSNLSCPKRERSTTAPQALALLNAEEAIVAAKAMAERLTKETTTDPARIERAYRLTLGRPPSPKELDRATTFLKDSPLSELCRALFNINEFVYLD